MQEKIRAKDKQQLTHFFYFCLPERRPRDINNRKANTLNCITQHKIEWQLCEMMTCLTSESSLFYLRSWKWPWTIPDLFCRSITPVWLPTILKSSKTHICFQARRTTASCTPSCKWTVPCGQVRVRASHAARGGAGSGTAAQDAGRHLHEPYATGGPDRVHERRARLPEEKPWGGTRLQYTVLLWRNINTCIEYICTRVVCLICFAEALGRTRNRQIVNRTSHKNVVHFSQRYRSCSRQPYRELRYCTQASLS